MKRVVASVWRLLAVGIVGALALAGSLHATPIPSDIAGIEGWYEADKGVTTSGGVVQTWADQSGKNRTATTAGGAAPVLATNQLNGLPAVQFRRAGGDDFLDISGNFFAKELYWVFKSPNPTFNNYGGVFGWNGNRNSNQLMENNNTTFHGNQYPASVSKNGTALTLASSFNMAPITQYMLLKVDVNDADTNTHPYQIGRTDGWSFDMDLAEVIAYNRALSPTEENTVGYYLARKYGLTTSYFNPGPDYTLTYDGTGAGKWDTPARWTSSPLGGPAFPNQDTTRAVVNDGDVTVGADRLVHSLQVALAAPNAGEVIIGAGSSLTVPNGVEVGPGGALTLQSGGKLVADSGSIDLMKTAGSATVGGIGTVSVKTFTDQGIAATLTKQGAGTLTLQNVTAGAGSAFNVAAGTLAAQYPTYLDKAGLVLSGGTFDVTGQATDTPGLRGGSLFGNNTSAANPGNFGIVAGPQGMLRDDTLRNAHWLAARGDGTGNGPGDTTLVYTGQIYLAGTTTFVEQCDDNTLLKINGVTVINDGNWNNAISGTYTPPSAGWYSFDVRFYNGGGGYGFTGQQDTGQGDSNWDTATFGFGYASGTVSGENAQNYAYPPQSLFRLQVIGAIDMSTTPVSVTAKTAGSVLRANSDLSASFGTLTFGYGSDLTVTGAPTTFSKIVTSGGLSSLGLSTPVLTKGFNDQGIGGILRLYGTKSLTIQGNDYGSVSVKTVSLQVDSGATLAVTGRTLLGGASADPAVILNGGTFVVTPAAPTLALPNISYPNAYMMGTNVSVIGNSTSTIQANTTGTVALGTLQLVSPATLTTTGPGNLDFLKTTLAAPGTSTFNVQTRTAGGSLHAGGLTTTLAVTGSSSLIFERPSNGLENTTIQVQSGATLGLVGSDRARGAAIQLAGGNLVLGSPDGSNQTYTNSISGGSTLTAGASGIGVAKGDIILTNLVPGAGKTVTLKTEGTHRLVLANAINVPTASLTVSQGQVLAKGALSLNSLTLSGGTTTTLTNGTTLTSGLSGNGALITQGTFTIDPQQSLAFTGKLNVASGDLTINAPASSMPAGALARYTFDNAGDLGQDSMGYANGTPLSNNGGALPTQVPGKIGGAVSLSVANQNYINLPAGFDDFTTGITVAGWVNYASFTNWNRLMDFGNGAGNNNILFARIGTGADIRWEMHGTAGGTMSQDVGGGPLQNNQWYFVAATVDPAGGVNKALSNIYINGNLVSTKTNSNVPSNVVRNNNYIGRSNWGGDDFIDGIVDELAIYKRALSQSDVQTLYQVGLTGKDAALVGDVTLAPPTKSTPGTSITFGGSETPLVNSVAVTGGPTITGPLTVQSSLIPRKLDANAPGTLAVDAPIKAQSFVVTGPGTVALKQNVTVDSGGAFGVDTNATVRTEASLTIDARSAAVGIRGALNVQSGTLTFNVPDGGPAIPAGPAAYYSFNSNTVNGRWVTNLGTLGTAKNGYLDSTQLEAPPGITSPFGGKIGEGMTIAQGSTQFLNLQPVGSVDIGSDWTIATWYKDLQSTGNWRTLVRGDQNDHQIMGENNSNRVGMYANGRPQPGNPPNAEFWPSGATLTPYDGWHHIAAVGKANDTTDYYVDGVLVGTAARSSTTNVSWIGNGHGDWRQTWANVLDEFFVYNRGLSAAEIGNLYQAGVAGSYGPPSLGKLTMAPATTLVIGDKNGVAGNGLAAVDSITAGNGATIQGKVVLNGPVTVGNSIGTLTVTGDLAAGTGANYQWEAQYDWAGKAPLSDRIDVSGTLDLSNNSTLTISPLGVLKSNQSYDLFTYGTLNPVLGTVTLARANTAYADLLNLGASTFDFSVANRIGLTIVTTPTAEWRSLSDTAWNVASNWKDSVLPSAVNAAVVNTNTAVATITAGMGTQKVNTLIVDGGSLLVNAGANLQVTDDTVMKNAWVEPTGVFTLNGTLGAAQLTTAGTTTFGPAAVLNVPKINVTGNTTTSLTTGLGTLLGPTTTLTLAGGVLAGSFESTNPSTTPGSYAFEIMSGVSNAALRGNTASLHVAATAGTTALNGPVTLNTMSVEGGNTTINDNEMLKLNTLTVSGGSLNLNRPAQIGSVNLSGGTTTTTRGMTVTSSMGGAGTLVADGSQVMDLSSATAVGFGGTLRVTSSIPANSGDLLVKVPTPNMLQAVTQNFDTLGTAYTPRNEAGTSWSIVNQGLPNSNFMRLLSNVTGSANQMAFDRTLTGPQGAVSAKFDMRFSNTANGADGAAFVLLPTATYGTTGTGPNGPGGAWEEPSLPGTFGVGFDIYDNLREVSLHWNGANVANVQAYDYREKGWQQVNVDVQYGSGGAYVSVGIAGNSIYSSYFIPGMTPYESRALFAGRTGGLAHTLDVDNIDLKMGTAAASLGDLRLDPASRFALGGGGVATFTSIGATAGITITGPMTLAGAVPKASSANAQSLTVNGTLNAANFKATNPGTVTLTDNLTLGAGGTVSVPQGTTLATAGTVALDISKASLVQMSGGLSVASGALTIQLPAGVAGPPASGLQAYYTFNNASNLGQDSGPNSNNLSNVGAPAYSAQGLVKGALQLNGASRLTAGVFPTGVPTGGNAYTIAGWVNPDANNGNGGYIGWGDWGTTRGSNAIRSNGALGFGNYWWNDDLWSPTVPDLTAGAPPSGWHFIVATFDPAIAAGNNQFIYLDGTLVNQRRPTAPGVLGQNFNIGATNNNTELFRGYLDDMAIYNRALSTTEVQSMYNTALSGGYSRTVLGNLTMAPNTQLTLNGGRGAFLTATTGNGATITGNVAVDGLLDPMGNLTVKGNLELGELSLFKLDLSPDTLHAGTSGSLAFDVIVPDSLTIDKTFTLQLFGAGYAIQRDDKIQLFQFDPFTGLTIGTALWDGSDNSLNLAALLQIGNLDDPFREYVWDTSEARLVADHEGIYLIGLTAALVPEPASLTLLALGGLALLRRRRGRRTA